MDTGISGVADYGQAPIKSEVAVLQAAFTEAIEIMNTERPYGQSTDGIWWKWDNGWKYLGKMGQEKESEKQL